jgi:sugar lactone lactonase YvrE
MADVTVALRIGAELGEGPVWDVVRARLVFVDITGHRIHLFDPRTATARTLTVPYPIGAIACTVRGDWVAAAAGGFWRVNPETGAMALVANVEAVDAGTRMNDGAVDAAGRFWAGSTSLTGQEGQGTLWRLDPDGTAHRMLAPVTTSNGPDWNPDSTRMYYADTRTRRVDVFDFHLAEGAVTNRRTFVDFAGATGRPDGVIVDADGGVWVALWAGGAVHRYTPDGRLDQVVAFPVTLTTKCAFGGPALEDLYVTTAAGRLTPEEHAAQPLAGALFHVRPGPRGRPPHLFRG